MRAINEIIIHHTASGVDALTWEQIRGVHLERGWSDIGYHFGFVKDGDEWSLRKGRPVEVVGAHAKGRNSHSIGVVVEGNYETTPFPKEIFWSVVDVVWRLARDYKIKPGSIFGHREVASTLCPGKYFPLEAIRGGVADQMRIAA